MAISDIRLAALMDDHAAAVEEFFHRAAQVTSPRWDTPRADGKWTPAQEVLHVVLSYEAFTRELRGGAGMRPYGNRFKRLIWRAIGLTWILVRKKIPRGARAPREVRPPDGPHDQAKLLADFRERTAEFESVFRDAMASNPSKSVTHPYFGAVDLINAIKVVTVHTRHHAAVLPPPGARQQIGA
jgi:hypothetical protein